MDIRGLGSRLGRVRVTPLATALCAALMLASVLPAGAAEKTVTDTGSFAAQAASSALRIRIGDTEITLAGGDSAASYERSRTDVLRLKVDDRFLAACGAGAVPVPGGDVCVSRTALRAAGFPHADADTILGDELVDAGFASYTPADPILAIRGQDASATARGLVLPGLAAAEAVCSASKLVDDVTGISIPDALAPIVSGTIASASCRVDLDGLPDAANSSGEIALDLNLTKTLVDSSTDLNDALDTIQEGLGSLPPEVSGPVNNAIDAIRDELDSHPLVSIRIAPTRGFVDADDAGIDSGAPGVAVRITVLGGLLEIEVGLARTAAEITDGVPEAVAETAFVRVKALNVTTADPDDAIISEEIAAPQDLDLLGGTPLATSIATSRGITSTTCPPDSGFTACASATGDAVSLRTLADPLPTVSVELMHSESLAAARFTKVAAAPVLPATGAVAGSTALAGLGLAVGALLIRRWLR